MNQLGGQMSNKTGQSNCSIFDSGKTSQSQNDEKKVSSDKVLKTSINSEKVIHGYKKSLHNRIRMSLSMNSEQEQTSPILLSPVLSYGESNSRSDSPITYSNRSSPGINDNKLLDKGSPSRSQSSVSIGSDTDEKKGNKKYLNGISNESHMESLYDYINSKSDSESSISDSHYSVDSKAIENIHKQYDDDDDDKASYISGHSERSFKINGESSLDEKIEKNNENNTKKYKDWERRKESNKKRSNERELNSNRSKGSRRSNNRDTSQTRSSYKPIRFDRDNYTGDFTSICLKNLNESIGLEKLKNKIYYEFRHYRGFSVKIVNNKKSAHDSNNVERICFVNFMRHSDAREARQTKMNTLVCGFPLYIEPVFKYRPSMNGSNNYGSRYNRSSIKPSSHIRRRISRSRSRSPSSIRHRNHRSRSSSSSHHSNNDNNQKFSISIHTPTRNRSRSNSSGHKSSSRMDNYPSENSKKETEFDSLLRNHLRSANSIYYSESSNRMNQELNDPKNEKTNQKDLNGTILLSKDLVKKVTRSSSTSRSISQSSSRSRSSYLNKQISLTSIQSPPEECSRSKTDRELHDARFKRHRLREESSFEEFQKDCENLINNRLRNDVNEEKSTRRYSDSSGEYFYNLDVKPRKRSSSPPFMFKKYPQQTPLFLQYSQKSLACYYQIDKKDATRTLFIGNLDNGIQHSELKIIFGKFGFIDEIDIKRNQPNVAPYSTNKNDEFTSRKAYAFLKFDNMDMAVAARHHMNGEKIGENNFECKIGYGKAQPTRCLWVGGLHEETKLENFQKVFERFSLKKSYHNKRSNRSETSPIKIVWRPNNALYALVLFDSLRESEEARYKMRGKSLPINSNEEHFRVDYHDLNKLDPGMLRERRSTSRTNDSKKRNDLKHSLSSNREYSNRNQNVRTPSLESNSSATSETRSITNRKLNGHSITPSLRNESPSQYPLVSNTQLDAKYSDQIETKNADQISSFSLTDDELDAPDRILINSKNCCPEIKRTKRYLIDQDLENIIITTTENKRRIDKASTLQNALNNTKDSSNNMIHLRGESYCSYEKPTSSLLDNKTEQKDTIELLTTERNEEIIEIHKDIRSQKRNRLDSTDFDHKGKKSQKTCLEKTIELISEAEKDTTKIEASEITNDLGLNNNDSQLENFLNSSSMLHRYHKIHKYKRFKEEKLQFLKENDEIMKNLEEEKKALQSYVQKLKDKKQMMPIEDMLDTKNGLKVNEEIEKPLVIDDAEKHKENETSIKQKASDETNEPIESETNIMETSADLSSIKSEISDKHMNKLELNITTNFELDEGEINEDEGEPGTSESVQSNSKQFKNTKTTRILKSSVSKEDISVYSSDTKKLVKDHFIIKRIIKGLLSIELITSEITESWSGYFTLKKHLFPTKFYFLAGSKSLAEKVLPKGINGPILRISQRLRLDQAKAEELEKKLFDYNFNCKSQVSFSILVALPFKSTSALPDKKMIQQNSLVNLTSYLDQKCAAGVIQVPNDEKPQAMMHVFSPSCQITNKIVTQLLPSLKRSKSDNLLLNNDLIIIVLFKNNSLISS